MKLKVYNSEGASQGEMEIADDLLVSGDGDQAVHETIVAHLDACRARSARTLNKGEVAGSNRKPWRQKGTGRARAGYRSSPIWRGGGVVFGPREGHSTKKVTRKTRKLAFRRALSERIADGSIRVLDELALGEAKTKAIVSLFSVMEIAGAALLILALPDKNISLAARNLPGVEVSTAGNVDCYEILKYPAIVATRAAMEELTSRLQGGEGASA